MISVGLYFITLFIGQILRDDYNWVTTDISSLTAKGAPNAGLLSVLFGISSILVIIFFLGMLIRTKESKYNKITRLGYILFFILMNISFFGYLLFPLEGDKTQMTFNNLMHIIATIAIVVLTLCSMFVLAYGYLKKEKMKIIGELTLGFAVAITIFGLLNVIGISNNWNILGITERLNIFTLEIYIFLLSYLYTFKEIK
jgi:heme A synthase